MHQSRPGFVTVGLCALVVAGPALAATAKTGNFGQLPDGRPVRSVTLSNAQGMRVTVVTYGAALQAVMVRDREGKSADVLLGYPALADYLAKPQYFGATVGRFANRIARGKFSLDGQTYQAPVNNGVNSLHGGTTGFDKVLWSLQEVRGGAVASATMRYVSPDGDQGYPGTMTVTATYSLDEANRLGIEYRATTDRATIVNITNHAYWNLAGEGAASGAMGHLLTIPAQTYLPTDSGSIPTGERRAVAGTAFDFRTAKPVGARVRYAGDPQLVLARGYDHNWIVGETPTASEHLMARVEEPTSGRGFALWSNQPGLQF